MTRYVPLDTQPTQDSDSDASSDVSLSEIEADLGDLSIDMQGAASPHRKPVALPIPSQHQAAAEAEAKIPRFDYAEVLLEHGYAKLVDAVVSEEGVDHNIESWRVNVVALLASMPWFLLYSALNGTLAQECLASNNPAVCSALTCPHSKEQSEWLADANKPETPAIYCRFLTDGKGESLPPQDLIRLTQVLREYVSGLPSSFQTALAIDNYKREQSTELDIENGYHHFLDGKASRVEHILTWCAAVEMRCKQVPEARWTEPLPTQFTYSGYSARTSVRMGQYDRGDSMSWLKKLVQAAIKFTMPTKGYDFNSFTIAYLAAREQIPFAERFFTRCLGSRVDQGGFCVSPPGQCSSAGTIKEERWEELRRLRNNNSPYYTNLEEEISRLHNSPWTMIGMDEEQVLAEPSARLANSTDVNKSLKNELRKMETKLYKLKERAGDPVKAVLEDALALMNESS